MSLRYFLKKKLQLLRLSGFMICLILKHDIVFYFFMKNGRNNYTYFGSGTAYFQCSRLQLCNIYFINESLLFLFPFTFSTYLPIPLFLATIVVIFLYVYEFVSVLFWFFSLLVYFVYMIPQIKEIISYLFFSDLFYLS